MHGSKEIISIKNSSNGFLYKRPMVIRMTHSTNEINLGNYTSEYPMFKVNNNIIIDWGDNSPTSTMINYNGFTTEGKIYHKFIDNKLTHDITFIGDITNIMSTCFYGGSLTSASLPYGLTTIAMDAFAHCVNLSSVSIPYGVTTLEGHAFNGCSSLSSIEIPNSVTTLEGYAFNGCNSLSSIEIPNSVTSIGFGCFGNCNNLNTYQLYWTGNNIITYDSVNMPNNTNTKFYVPKGQKTNYVNKGYPSAKVIERTS